MADIKKDLQGKDIVIGTERTLKELKKGGINKVYVSKNCREDTNEDIEHYAQIQKAEFIVVKENNEELGVMCKKPFPISVIGIR